MTIEKSYTHWHLSFEDQILWLSLDRAQSHANSLNASVMTEFSNILDSLTHQTLAGLVITSSKESGFIAGADVKEFSEVKDVNHAVELIRMGQKIFSKLENLPFPTVALIHGYCLGGGLELALACDYRIANNDEKTRLGLPEVMLGIHPGWGGTIRLPQLIGSLSAMELILTGRTVSAKAAKHLGLIDDAVPKRQMKAAAIYFIKNKPSQRTAPTWQSWLANPLIRPLIASIFRKRLKQKINPKHYPAPYAVIEHWLENGISGEKAYVAEANSVGKLLLTSTAKNLRRVFELQDRLKNLGDKTAFSGRRVHVIGAGVMGGDIAAWCALKGFTVTLQDKNVKHIAPAIKRAYNLFRKKLKDPLLVRHAMDCLRADPIGDGMACADVIIEAIYEDLSAKKTLFQEIEQRAKSTAILATNTSSLLLEDIHQALRQPERLVGIHFFNPVDKMPLVEIVESTKTLNTVKAAAIAFVLQLGKLPLPVKSSPGFLVNRVLSNYLLEAGLLAKEGVPLAAIDTAALEFGMPMGPIELMDTVGIDIILSAASHLPQKPSEDLLKILQQLVSQNHLGKKTGRGFYTYKNGKPQKPQLKKNDQIPEGLTSRLVSCLTDEAVIALQENIVADADLVDAGIIFGTGFAPFRGGPIHNKKLI